MPPKPQEDSTMQSDAGALVAQGATLMRIQNETMFAVSVQRPRNEDEAVKRALEDLDKLLPADAQKAFYSIPYRDHATGRTVMVTGPSIDAAMGMVRRWGNASAGVLVLREDATGWDLEGYYIDLENPLRIGRPFRASKFYRPKGGKGPTILPHERQLQAFQSAVSKAMRNSVLEGLPKYFVRLFDQKARKLAAGGKEEGPVTAETRQSILAVFAKWTITKAQLEQYAEKPVAKWTGEDAANLRGLWNAIQDGQITPEEAFAVDLEPGAESAKLPLDELAAKMVPPVPAPAPPVAPAAVQTEPVPAAPQAPAPDPRRSELVKTISLHLTALALKPKIVNFLKTKHLGTAEFHAAPVERLEALENELGKLVAMMRSAP